MIKKILCALLIEWAIASSPFISAHANDAPMLDFIYDLPIYVPGPEVPQVVFHVSAMDVNGDTLTFEQAGMPTDLCFFQQTSNTTATFTCEYLGDPMEPTPPPQGIFPTTVTVIDDGVPTEADSQGFNIFTTTIEQQPPQLAFINNQTVAEEAELIVGLSATDAEQNALAFSTENMPGFCILTDYGDKTGDIACNPKAGDGGSYVITVSVTDDGTPWVAETNSEPLSDSQAFELVVGGSNQAPVLNPIGNQSIADGSQLQIDIFATDADMDQLSFDSTPLPGFCDPLQDFGDGTARIICNPVMEAGNYSVTVTVTDDGVPSLFDDETFTIIVTPTDYPPEAEAGNSRPVLVRQPASLDGQGYDMESFEVGFSWDVLSVPPGSGVDLSALSDPATPDPIFVPDVSGDFEFELTVTDDVSQTAIDTVILTAGRDPVLVGLNGDQLHQLNPQTGASYLRREVVIDGQSILDGNGMAADYAGGPLYGAFEVDGLMESALAIIDPSTGSASLIGGLGDYVSALTFDSDGILYAVTADIAMIPQTLYAVDLATGAMTFIKTLGTDCCNPTEGDVIAFNRDDGLLYRAARLGNTGIPPLFESIDLATLTTTTIPLASSGGGDRFEVTAMVWDPKLGLFVASRRQPFNSLFSQAHYFLGSDGTISNTLNQSAARRGYTFLQPPRQATGDQNGDGLSDILWRNTANGQNAIWLMDGGQRLANIGMQAADPTWSAVGRGDYNGDGTSDILWRRINPGQVNNGQILIWLLQGGEVIGTSALPSVGNDNWKVVGDGDFNGDGDSDILWRNVASGRNAMWLINDGNRSATPAVTRASVLDWEIVGDGDFDGDGKADILWRNRATGENAVWLMDGATRKANASLPSVPGSDWQVAGNADYGGDGKADILWRNVANGSNALWEMEGTTRVGNKGVPAVINLKWSIIGDGDYNGDGKADILWRQTVNGRNAVWLMDGDQRIASQKVPTVRIGDWEPVIVN